MSVRGRLGFEWRSACCSYDSKTVIVPTLSVVNKLRLGVMYTNILSHAVLSNSHE